MPTVASSTHRARSRREIESWRLRSRFSFSVGFSPFKDFVFRNSLNVKSRRYSCRVLLGRSPALKIRRVFRHQLTHTCEEVVDALQEGVYRPQSPSEDAVPESSKQTHPCARLQETFGFVCHKAEDAPYPSCPCQSWCPR